MILQGIPEVWEVKANGDIRAVGGRNMILEGKGHLRSVAGKGLRWLKGE